MYNVTERLRRFEAHSKCVAEAVTSYVFLQKPVEPFALGRVRRHTKTCLFLFVFKLDSQTYTSILCLFVYFVYVFLN